jgi:outer membrane lipoprotein carrier protein
MRLVEVDGATTEFSFSSILENIAIPTRTFTFDAPPGVAVVDGLAPI